MKILPSQECACHFLCDDTFEYHVVRIVTIWPRSLGANDVLRHIPDEAHRSSPNYGLRPTVWWAVVSEAWPPTYVSSHCGCQTHLTALMGSAIAPVRVAVCLTTPLNEQQTIPMQISCYIIYMITRTCGAINLPLIASRALLHMVIIQFRRLRFSRNEILSNIGERTFYSIKTESHTVIAGREYVRENFTSATCA
jgi:hypothetical protein